MEIGDIVIYREKGMAELSQDTAAIVTKVHEGDSLPNLDLRIFTQQGDFDLREIEHNPDGKPNTWRLKANTPQLSSSDAVEESEE